MGVGHITLLERDFHIAGHLELLGGNQHKPHIRIPAHGGDEGMHRAAKLQVTAQPYRQAVELAFLRLDGEQVGQRLGGVVVPAVTGVDDRDARMHRGHGGRALLGVAHGDDVRIAAHRADGVCHALPLGSGAGSGFREAQHLPAQLVHRRFKAEARARGRLEKQGGQLLVPADVPVFVRVPDDVLGGQNELIDLLK